MKCTLDKVLKPTYSAPMIKKTDCSLERAVHLVDVENLLAGPTFSDIDVMGVMESYSIVSERRVGDHVVIATCHRAAPAAWFGWPDARRLVRSGPNGADLALLEVMAAERLAKRYGRIVIGSGDGIFADAAAALQSEGVHVSVITRRGQLSRRLAFAVKDVRYLEDIPVPAMPSAIRETA